jgi:hypothetical protein
MIFFVKFEDIKSVADALPYHLHLRSASQLTVSQFCLRFSCQNIRKTGISCFRVSLLLDLIKRILSSMSAQLNVAFLQYK